MTADESKTPESGHGSAPDIDEIPDMVVKRSRGVSIVWLVPLIAALIGGWLWYRTMQEKGPTISIDFETAQDLEAGKTLIKFKSVAVGKVSTIAFKPDLSGVVLTAAMDRRADALLTDSTRFWVVRPRIGMRGISGLGTIVSGAYIELEPAGDGALHTVFTGLEDPPVAPADAPGLKLRLSAQGLGSLDNGSGVYFRDILVGQVEGHRLAVDDHDVEVDIYIEPQFAALIHSNTRFWNASGIDLSLGAGGIEFSVPSLDSLIRGGIAFETPADKLAGALAKSGDSYALFENRTAAYKKTYVEALTVIMYFTGSVRGLSIGAAVDHRGITVGSVKDFWLEFDVDKHETRIAVLAGMQSGVARRYDVGPDVATAAQALQGLIDAGLRAQLGTGSLLTGSLFIELDTFPGTPAVLVGNKDYTEIPTIPSTTETITNAISDLSGTVSDLRTLIQRLDDSTPELLASVKTASQSLEQTLDQATQTLQRLELLADDGAKLRGPLEDTLRDLGASLRSVQRLAELLERQPDVLIKGKPEGDY